MKLLTEAISKFLLGVLLVGLLIFIPAGTINYFNGWLLMILLFIPMFIAGLIMLIKNPNLLSIRLKAKEEENDQKLVLKLSALMFISGFVLSGLNYRFNWITLPNYIIIISSIIFIISYIMYGIVLYQNTYLSRKIEVLDNHKLIDRGLYKIVRHPMYTITIFLFLSIPLILNSLISFIIFLSYIPIINIRIKNEEKVLEKDLKGYKEYKNKVKYKLLPYIY